MAVDGRISVDLHAAVGSENGLRDGSIILVSDEMASSGAFVLHDLMKRHLKSGGRGASSACSEPSTGIPHQHSIRSDSSRNSPQRHVDNDGCATAVCLVALTRTPTEHCVIAKRQVTLIQHLLQFLL